MDINLAHPTLMNTDLIDAQCIELHIKFCSVREDEKEYFIHAFINNFLSEYEKHTLLYMQDDDDKIIKLKNVEKYFLKNKRESSVIGGMIVKNGLDPAITSYAKAEKYFDRKLDLCLEDEEEDFLKNRAGLLPRSRFIDDESFIKHTRRCLAKDVSIQIQNCLEDLDFHISFNKNKGGLYNGEFTFTCRGYTVNYQYADMIESWKTFIFLVSNHVKNMLANIRLIKSSEVIFGDYIVLIREGVNEKYNDKDPWEICLLDNIGWFNYIPNTIISERIINKGDSNIVVREETNGVCIWLKKDIKNLATADILYLRKNYLDQYLLKGRCIIDDDVDEYSTLKNDGEIYPFYEEEICLKKTRECGRTLYGIEFVPLEEQGI